MDSLRYWVEEMHVDGFRFDLASTLARGLHEVDQLSSFFTVIHQDPVVSHVKLIAEPWDVGEGGYQVGNFPVRWAEWNGSYRDTMRAFWRGDGGRSGELAYRLTGSSRSLSSGAVAAPPRASTSSPRTTASRCAIWSRTTTSTTRRTARTIATGTHEQPVVELRRGGRDRRPERPRPARQTGPQPAGDAAAVAGHADDPRRATSSGSTQQGNNNAYCQDNEISWLRLEPRRRATRPARVRPQPDPPPP